MKNSVKIKTFSILVLGVALLSSAVAQVPIIQPGAPGQPSRQITIEEASDLASLSYTDADVKFMQGMIMHHSQALQMAEMVETRSSREAIQLMALRISLSQEDEIAMMEDWLVERGLPRAMPMADMQAMAANPEMMPGILTEAEFNELAGLAGQEFDSRFLQLMIKHHEGGNKHGRSIARPTRYCSRFCAFCIHYRCDLRPDQRDRAHERDACRILPRSSSKPQTWVR